MESVLWWTLCLVLGVPASLLLFLNWGGLIDALRKRRNFSFAPPWLCGLAGAVACWACPVEEVQAFWWLPLVIDASISLMVLWLIWFLIRSLTGLIGIRFPSDDQPKK